MADDIQIHIDPIEVQIQMQRLKNIKDGAPRATMRAMNKTVKGMKTDARREISARYLIKQKDTDKKLAVEKATMSDLSIAVRSKGRPMRLVKFSTKPNKNPGVKGSPTAWAKVKKSESGDFTGGFMATMAGTNGIDGIFKRTGQFKTVRKGKFRGQKKETLKQLYGPGTVQMLDNTKAKKNIQEKAEERFYKALDHEVNYLLGQQRR